MALASSGIEHFPASGGVDIAIPGAKVMIAVGDRALTFDAPPGVRAIRVVSLNMDATIGAGIFVIVSPRDEEPAASGEAERIRDTVFRYQAGLESERIGRHQGG